MSLDVEAALREFLASAPQTKYMIEVISISHSNLTQTYHLWREPADGAVVDEDSNTLIVRSTNFQVGLAGSPDNLDQKFTISIDTTDAENVLRKELDRIPLGTTEKIIITYRAYLSDDLTEPQAVQRLQAESINYNRGTATISAVARKLNVLKTGELYTFNRFPMLRGFL